MMRTRSPGASDDSPATATLACSSDSRSMTQLRVRVGAVERLRARRRIPRVSPEPRTTSFVSVLLPQSRITRSAAGRLTTRASTVRAQSSQAGGAERDLHAVVVDVVAGPQLGEPVELQAEARRRRRADADFLARHAERSRRRPPASSSVAPRPRRSLPVSASDVAPYACPAWLSSPLNRRPGSAATRATISAAPAASGSMPQRWKPTSTLTRTSTSRPRRVIAADQPRATSA